MNKRILLGLALIASTSSIIGCNKNTEIRHSVNKLMEYVFEVPTYKQLDEEYAQKYFKDTYYNWGGGCSAVAKTLPDGHTVVGRNMDLNISNKCAYIVRTEVGKYKTFGLSYTFRDISPNYDEVLAKGIPDDFYKLLPYMCDDIMNDQGLYVEINMRNNEYWPTGEDKYSCSGTNPESEHTTYMFAFSRYIAENCATVHEAFTLAESYNVYSKNYYWNYAFMVADANGVYGLIEFAQNNVYCIAYQNCQTNFYVNHDMRNIEKIPCGEGRYNYLKDHIGGISNKDELFNLMKDVNYYQVYDPYNCKFDPRSENIGALPYLTYELMYDEDYKEIIYALLNEYGKTVRNLTRQEQQNLNKYWETTFTNIADCTDKTIFVRFFEDDNRTLLLTF